MILNFKNLSTHWMHFHHNHVLKRFRGTWHIIVGNNKKQLEATGNFVSVFRKSLANFVFCPSGFHQIGPLTGRHRSDDLVRVSPCFRDRLPLSPMFQQLCLNNKQLNTFWAAFYIIEFYSVILCKIKVWTRRSTPFYFSQVQTFGKVKFSQ